METVADMLASGSPVVVRSLTTNRARLVSESQCGGPPPGLGHGNRREVDADQAGASRAGQPQARAATPTAKIGKRLSLLDGESVADVVQQIGGEEGERFDLVR